MVKLIGVLLIASGLLSLIAGAFIELNHDPPTQITGNVISNILVQQPIAISFADYLAGFAFSYSIASLIMGIVFLFRV